MFQALLSWHDEVSVIRFRPLSQLPEERLTYNKTFVTRAAGMPAVAFPTELHQPPQVVFRGRTEAHAKRLTSPWQRLRGVGIKDGVLIDGHI